MIIAIINAPKKLHARRWKRIYDDKLLNRPTRRVHWLDPYGINRSITTDPFFSSVTLCNCVACFSNYCRNNTVGPFHSHLTEIHSVKKKLSASTFNFSQVKDQKQLHSTQNMQSWVTYCFEPDWIPHRVRPSLYSLDSGWNDPPDENITMMDQGGSTQLMVVALPKQTKELCHFT